MSNRPPALCNIKKGKALGAQDNFADTFNWMTSCIDNLKGGTGIKVEWTSTDTPEISLDQDYIGGGSGGGGGGGGVSEAVYDVDLEEAEQTDDPDQLKITYTDDRADKYIDIPRRMIAEFEVEQSTGLEISGTSPAGVAVTADRHSGPQKFDLSQPITFKIRYI